jgi:hypothetical protein
VLDHKFPPTTDSISASCGYATSQIDRHRHAVIAPSAGGGDPNGRIMWEQISEFLFDNYAVASRRQRSSSSAGTLVTNLARSIRKVR